MNLIATTFSISTLLMLGVVILQIRSQRLATEELLADNRIRTRLYQDADESTTFILSRTIQNISSGQHDPSLESDAFALKDQRAPRPRTLSVAARRRRNRIPVMTTRARAGFITRGLALIHAVAIP